jgi:hypothetical protein
MVDSGEDKAGDHGNTESRGPGRASQQLLHRGNGGRDFRGPGRADYRLPHGGEGGDEGGRHLWGARHANYPLPHLCKDQASPDAHSTFLNIRALSGTCETSLGLVT